MLRRKFAAIKLWSAKAAEDEIIERLKIAAKLLDLECLVVDSFARLINPPHTQLTQDDVDFVLSLHFEAPKRFDIFTLVTLWNPILFYTLRTGAYRRFTRNLLTHDDFLSCDSVSGDDHAMRSVSGGLPRERPVFRLYPTLSGPILEPTLGDLKMFYVGINWEKLWNQPGRHLGLLKLLDEGGDLRIYGPKLYGGVEVWEGFKSYVGPIPFDGVSVVRRINQAGISLVLSSEAHSQSEMMSSRVFESAAAGAVIICNENAFARRHFGDSLLYIDTTLPCQETYGQVQSHLAWIKSEPARALEMARGAQTIFRENFRLDTCLERIYAGLPARKSQLRRSYTPRQTEEKVCIVFLMPQFQPEILERHIASCKAQRNVAIRGIVAMDIGDAELFRPRVECRLGASQAPLEVAPVQFWERRPDGSVKRRKPIGEAVSEIIRSLVEEDYVCFVAPDEQLFSDHVCSLLRTLQDSPEYGCAWSDVAQADTYADPNQTELSGDPDAADSSDNRPIGTGRFLFRMSAIDNRIHVALRYLDALSMHLLLGTSKGTPTRRCSLLAVGPMGAYPQNDTVPIDLEREILIDFSPEVFLTSPARQIHYLPQTQQTPPAAPPMPEITKENHRSQPADLTIVGMTQEQRAQLAVELAHSVPFPPLLKRLAFGAYRLWFRMSSSHARNGNAPTD